MYINTIPMCLMNKQKYFEWRPVESVTFFIRQIKWWNTWPAWEQRTEKKRVCVAHDWWFQCWMIYRTQEGHMICQLLNWFTFKTRLAIVRYSSHKIYHMIFFICFIFNIKFFFYVHVFGLFTCEQLCFFIRAVVSIIIRLVWTHRPTLSEMQMS